MKVLLAVDGSACSEAAVERLVQGFRPGDTEVRVLHAVEWMKEMPVSFQFGQGPAAGHDVFESRKRSFEQAEQLVSRVAGQLEMAGFRTSVTTPDADPRHAIIDAAGQWPADLIVMGSHGRRGLNRFLLGSVAESVVRHAACSVEIVRTPVAA